MKASIYSENDDCGKRSKSVLKLKAAIIFFGRMRYIHIYLNIN